MKDHPVLEPQTSGEPSRISHALAKSVTFSLLYGGFMLVFGVLGSNLAPLITEVNAGDLSILLAVLLLLALAGSAFFLGERRSPPTVPRSIGGLTGWSFSRPLCSSWQAGGSGPGGQ
ncbi:hypothetical protein N6H14_09340 [Paenibacillus sp. CC-CFT747]|nr:hypothetical protein N6H14_09340 [Paenibacillus sp. CC-CFT747]